MVTDGQMATGLSCDDGVLDDVALEVLETSILSHASRLAAETARWVLWVAAYDRRKGWESWDLPSCAAWLSVRCGMSIRTGREHVRVGRALEHMPLVRACFLAGELSYSKVRALTRVADEYTEYELVRLGRWSSATQIENLCGSLRQADKNLQEENQDAANAATAGSVTFNNEGSGMASITIVGPVDDVIRAHNALLAAADREIDAEHRPGEPVADTIERLGGVAAVQADTALAVLDGTLDSIEGPFDDASIVIDYEMLTDADTSEHVDSECGTHGTCTYGGERIAPDVGRRLLCDARVQLSVENSVGDPFAISKAARYPNRAMRRKLLRRDHQLCQFPGCVTKRRLHAHHIVFWEHDGPTELDNLILLCHRHHRSVHEGGWSIVRRSDGRAIFTNPDGIQVDGTAVPPTPGPIAVPAASGGPAGPFPDIPIAGSGERYNTYQTASDIHLDAQMHRRQTQTTKTVPRDRLS